MRVVRAVCLSTALVWLVLPVATGRAEVLGGVAAGRELVAGPVWAGREAVWAESGPGGALYVRASGQGSRVATFRRVDGLAQGIVDVAASGQRVALVRRVVRPAPPAPPCDAVRCPMAPEPLPTPVVDEVWAGPAGGPLRRIMSRGPRARCAALVPTDVEVAGSVVLVAEARSNDPCAFRRPQRVSGRITLLTPTGTRRVLAVFRAGMRPWQIAAAGKWLAWGTNESIDGSVAVFDRHRRRVVYRVPMRRFAFESFDLDAHGRVALVGNARHRHPCGPNRPVAIYRLAVASPAHPQPRLLAAHAGVVSVALAGGRLVSIGAEPPCYASEGLVVTGIAPASRARPVVWPGECSPRFAHYGRSEFNGNRLLALSARAPCELSRRAGTVIMSLSVPR